MPIFGRKGESYSRRLFGPAGAGQTTIKSFTAGPAIAKRVIQGFKTPGGFLGKKAQASSGPVVYGGVSSGPNQNFSPAQNFAPVRQTSVVPTVDTSNPGGGGGGKSVNLNSNDYTDLQSLKDAEDDARNSNYNSEKSRLNGLEDRTRAVYGQSVAQAQAYYPEFQRMVGEQQASTEGQLGNLENQRKYESERSLGQARQLLNDLNRRQAAQMSASGNYGTSVPEAYADQFGNKAYAAQNQIQTSRDQALNEIANKRVEAKQYFDSKLFEGKQKYDTLITGLQQQLNATLDQIGGARSQSAAAKNAAGVQAWNNYVNNKFSLDQELRQYQQSLTQYAAESSVGENPLANPAISGIQTSNSQQIMAGTQANVAQGGQTMNQFTPMTRRRLTAEEEKDQQMSGYGIELNGGAGY